MRDGMRVDGIDECFKNYLFHNLPIKCHEFVVSLSGAAHCSFTVNFVPLMSFLSSFTPPETVWPRDLLTCPKTHDFSFCRCKIETEACLDANHHHSRVTICIRKQSSLVGLN